MQNVQTLESAVEVTAVETSTPEFVAPVVPVAPPTVARQPELPPILVADDDEDDTYLVQRFIKRTGIKNRILTFNDGTEVVNYLSRARLSEAGQKHRQPLLLFLDLNMAGLGGLGFLEWARSKKELAPLTIVVLTNSCNPEDMQRAIELGADRYLVKYPSLSTFTTIVRSVYPQTVF